MDPAELQKSHVHTVAVLALEQVIPFDLSTPLEVFAQVRLPDGRHPYEIGVCAPAAEVRAQNFVIRAAWGLDALQTADTIIVAGCAPDAPPPGPEVLDALRRAATRGIRIASICSGAFILAETGLLDGLAARTHWAAATEFARRYPRVELRPEVLYVDNGQLLTSAGAAAGLDLCLHMIRRDWGSAVAANAARLSVMPVEREGGQAQFVIHPQPPVSSGLAIEPLRWVVERIDPECRVAVQPSDP